MAHIAVLTGLVPMVSGGPRGPAETSGKHGEILSPAEPDEYDKTLLVWMKLPTKTSLLDHVAVPAARGTSRANQLTRGVHRRP